MIKKFIKACAILLALAATPAIADSVLIIDAGYSTVTQNVKGRLEIVGHTVTVTSDVSLIPTATSTYQQVWDLRYSAALTSGEQTAYTSFVTAGGFAYFVTENPGCCMSRNNSVAALITGLGGGTTTIGANFNTAADVESNVNTTYMTAGITVNYAAVSAIINSQGIPLIQDGTGDVSGMSWIGRAGALGQGVTGTIVTVADTNWLDNVRFSTAQGATLAQQQNVTALDDIIRGIVAGTVAGTISANGNGAGSQQQNQNQAPTPVGQPTTTTLRGPASIINGTWTPYASTQVDARTNSGKNGVITRTVNSYDARTVTRRVVVTPVSNQAMSDGSTVSTNGTPFNEDTAQTPETRLGSSTNSSVSFPRVGFTDLVNLRKFNPFLIDPMANLDGAWVSPSASYYKTLGHYSTADLRGGYQWSVDNNTFGVALNYGSTKSGGLDYSQNSNDSYDGVAYALIKDSDVWVKASVGMGYGKMTGTSSIPTFALSNSTKFNQKTFYGDIAVYSAETYFEVRPFIGATILHSSIGGVSQQGSPLLSTAPETKSTTDINPYVGIRYDLDKNFGIEGRVTQSKDFKTVGSIRATAKTEIMENVFLNAAIGLDKGSNLSGISGTIGIKINF